MEMLDCTLVVYHVLHSLLGLLSFCYVLFRSDFDAFSFSVCLRNFKSSRQRAIWLCIRFNCGYTGHICISSNERLRPLDIIVIGQATQVRIAQ